MKMCRRELEAEALRGSPESERGPAQAPQNLSGAAGFNPLEAQPRVPLEPLRGAVHRFHKCELEVAFQTPHPGCCSNQQTACRTRFFT